MKKRFLAYLLTTCFIFFSSQWASAQSRPIDIELDSTEAVFWGPRLDSLYLSKILAWGKTLPQRKSGEKGYTKRYERPNSIQIFTPQGENGSVVIYNKRCKRGEGEWKIWYKRGLSFIPGGGNPNSLSIGVHENGKLAVSGSAHDKTLPKQRILELLEIEFTELEKGAGGQD